MIISILYNPAWMKDDYVKQIRNEHPQFNHVIKNTNKYLSPNKLDHNHLPAWPYYIIKLGDATKNMIYDKHTNILTCNKYEILLILENINNKHNVILDPDSVETYVQLLLRLEYKYKTKFNKVWEKKGKKYVYNRWVSAEFWGVINNIKWQFPELCDTGWHWSQYLVDALYYKREEWEGDNLYCWEMQCYGVIDYWENKVCCLSCSFTEPKLIDINLAWDITEKEEISWLAINREGQDTAPYLDIKFRAKYSDKLTLDNLSEIIEAIKRTQYSNNKYSLYLYKSESGIYTQLPHLVYPYNKKVLELNLTKRFWEEETKKIIKHLEDNCDVLEINPFR